MTGDAETLARVIRDAAQVGPLGPNAMQTVQSGGTIQLNGTEADNAAAAVLASDWLAAVRDEAARDVLDAADRLALNPDLNRNGAALARALRSVTALRAAPPTEDPS